MGKSGPITTLVTAGALVPAGCSSTAEEATFPATVTSTFENTEVPVETSSPVPTASIPTSGNTAASASAPSEVLLLEPVSSPVTGQTYEMSCAPRSEHLFSCTGSEGAAVYFY